MLWAPSLKAQHLFHTNITTKDGLPSNHVYGCVEDLDGYLWFFTEKGIAKYDGYEFKIFTTRDGIPSNDIWFLEVDAKNRIWIHCQSTALTYIENDSVKIATQLKETIRALRVNNIEGEPTTISTLRQLCLEDETTSTFTCYEKYSLPFAKDFGKKKKGTRPAIIGFSEHILLQKDSLLKIYKDGKMREYETDMDANDVLYGSEYFVNDSILVATNITKNKILFYFNHKAIKEKYNEDLKLLGDYSHVRINAYHNHILVTTDLGYLQYDLDFKLTEVYKIDKAQKEFQNIARFYKDRNDNIWISTFDKGVYKVTKKEKHVDFIFNENLSVHEIIAVEDRIIAASNRVHIITSNAENNKFSIKELDSKLYHISDISYEEEDQLLRIGRAKDFEVYNYKNHKIGSRSSKYAKLEHIYRDSFLVSCVRNIHYSKLDNYAVIKNCSATSLYDYDNHTVKSLRQSNYSAIEQFEETIYIGFSDGLYVLIDGNLKQTDYNYPSPFTFKVIDLKYQQGHGLWIATDGQGLFLLREDKSLVKIEKTEQYTLGNMELHDDEIWFVMNGISKVKYTDGNYETETILNQNDYFFNTSVNDFVFLKDKIFIATDLGIFSAPNERPIFSNHPIDFSFDAKFDDSTSVNPIELNLNFDQNNLKFNFKSVSLNEKPRYYHQLVGHDPERIVSSERLVNYSDLQPGEYNFVCGVLNNEESTEKSMDLRIHPAWWDTLLFKWLLGLLTIGIIYTGIKVRFNLQEQKKTAELEVEKKFTELELKALQSQLNPHFVFNCLGSIQYLINSNQNEKADIYLSKFAHLLRLFLDNSTKKMISLEDELEIIELYIALEQLRFSDNFDFILKLDVVAADQILVPSLIMQPLVENSISHGLFHRPKGGTIWLKISELDDKLHIELTDNGIGRKAARDIRRKSIKNYESKGGELIKERIETISLNLDLDITLQYEDHPFRKEAHKGTRVIIKMDKITEE